MDTITINHEGVPVTSSLRVAERFGKRHDNVIQAIERLEIPESLCLLNFQETSISIPMPNGGSKQKRVYLMTKDGFMLVVMGFTGKAAMRVKIGFIKQFNRMERHIRSQGQITGQIMDRLSALESRLSKIETRKPVQRLLFPPEPEPADIIREQIGKAVRRNGYPSRKAWAEANSFNPGNVKMVIHRFVRGQKPRSGEAGKIMAALSALIS